jgi:ADP-heptose:LPS heptosyltransferase
LESILPERCAQELLEHCLAGRPWPEHLLDPLIAEDGNRALFRILVERLGDLFEPRLCEVYADLFSEIIARRNPALHADHVAARYQRIRLPRKCNGDPAKVFVLSRVTLGADVAITSIMLDAAKQKFPHAEIHFVGPQKSWELFAADPRLHHLPISYGRSGTLDDRLSIWPQLLDHLSQPDGIVIDPDSRLTQLGLLPICSEDSYYFFESRSYGGDGSESLVTLSQRWVAETFDVADAKPYIHTGLDAPEFATTVSFGVGENPEKRIPDPFEQELLKQLPRPVLIDKGAGGEEAERVDRAVAAAGSGIEVWNGSFAGFAAHIAKSKLYVGYDSAGGHVAAACGVPLISIFAGFASERTFQRWRPTGKGPIQIVRADTTPDVLAKVSSLLRAASL